MGAGTFKKEPDDSRSFAERSVSYMTKDVIMNDLY